MPPPAIVCCIIRPDFFVIKFKKCFVRTAPGYIRALFIAFLIFIDSFSVHPFVEGTTVIKDTVQNHAHAPAVYLLDQFCKICVAGFQIPLVCDAADKFRCPLVFFYTVRQTLAIIHNNFCIMRVNIIIILYIVFMVGRRYKQRIEIDNIYAQVLQIIQFFTNALQITAIKMSDVHIVRILIPVLYLFCRFVNIKIFIIQHVIRGISIAETVDKYLIENCALCPVRHIKSRTYLKVIFHIYILLDSNPVVITGYAAGMYLKIIYNIFFSGRNHCRIVIK